MRFIVPLLAASLAIAAPAWAEAPAALAAAPAAGQALDSRFVALEGGRNFRDVGGYRTADGHVVKPGVLYRSGSLGKLTAAAQARLAQLHVRQIVDLRTTQERSRDTFDLRGAYGAGYWTRDYGHSLGNHGDRPALDPAKLTAASMTAMMTGAYRTFAREQAPSYRALFARLITGEGATVVNCTAGKDRTGIAAALVLTALGVPYETVRQDFLLTNGAPGMETLQGDISPMFGRLPPDVVAPLVGVEGVYLDTTFAQIRQDYDTVDAYLEKELGVGPAQVAALRARMLE